MAREAARRVSRWPRDGAPMRPCRLRARPRRSSLAPVLASMIAFCCRPERRRLLRGGTTLHDHLQTFPMLHRRGNTRFIGVVAETRPVFHALGAGSVKPVLSVSLVVGVAAGALLLGHVKLRAPARLLRPWAPRRRLAHGGDRGSRSRSRSSAGGSRSCTSRRSPAVIVRFDRARVSRAPLLPPRRVPAPGARTLHPPLATSACRHVGGRRVRDRTHVATRARQSGARRLLAKRRARRGTLPYEG
jgi:hypothetical protein